MSAHVADLRQVVDVLEQRCALRPGDGGPRGGSASTWLPHRPASVSPRPAAWRSCGSRSRRRSEDIEPSGRPSITVGGKRLWRNRNHLDEAGMTEQQWRARWDAARMFLTADGESGKPGGNETLRVDEAGRLRIKVPAALAAQFGTHLESGRRSRSATAAASGPSGWRPGARCATTSPMTRPRTAGIWTRPGNRTRSRRTRDRRAAHRSGVGCRSQRRSPRLLRDGWIRATRSGTRMTIPVDTAGLPAIAARWAGPRGDHRPARYRGPRRVHRGGDREPRFRRRPRHRPRNAGPRHPGETVPPHRGRHPHRAIPDPPDRDGRPPRHRDHRCRSGLHQQLGCPALA